MTELEQLLNKYGLQCFGDGSFGIPWEKMMNKLDTSSSDFTQLMRKTAGKQFNRMFGGLSGYVKIRQKEKFQERINLIPELDSIPEEILEQVKIFITPYGTFKASIYLSEMNNVLQQSTNAKTKAYYERCVLEIPEEKRLELMFEPEKLAKEIGWQVKKKINQATRALEQSETLIAFREEFIKMVEERLLEQIEMEICYLEMEDY